MPGRPRQKHILSDAEKTLLWPPSKEESDRRAYIRAWCRGLGIPENSIRSEYQTQRNGSADLYLTNRRIMIEVKKSGRLDRGPHANNTGSKQGETAFEQLSRYIKDESPREQLHLEDDVKEDLPWVGVVTDGKKWWLWEWCKRADNALANEREVSGWFGVEITKNNLRKLGKLINRETVGKEWATATMAVEFEDVLHDLTKMYTQRKDLPSTVTQRGLWLDQLRGSGNAPETDPDDVFIRHTLLVLISRMIMYSGTNCDREKIVEGFVKWVNFDEMDRLESIMNRYNWRQHKGDVLRSLYMDYIPEKHRKVYGEYYTPDWLAELLCGCVIDDDFIAEQIGRYNSNDAVFCVLDPCCGSGTFLYHAVKRIMESKPMIDSGMTRNDVIKLACRMVRGIDIHPVAVEMSRANMHRLLPNIDDSNIVVYQGDSLLTERSDMRLFGYGGENLVLVSPGNRHLILPSWFIKSARDVAMFVETAKNDKDMTVGLGTSLKGYDYDSLLESHNQMRDIIRNESNGVWKWYILNQAGPMNLKGTVGRIVSNPPWVRYNKIQVESRKNEIKTMAVELKLWTGGNVSTSFDIASLFVDRCSSLYMTSKTIKKTGWVIPHGSINGDGWKNFRQKFNGKNITRWNLARLPFPNTPTCVTFFNTDVKSGVLKKKKRVKLNPDDTWEVASKKIEWEKPARSFPLELSEYVNERQKAIARQGATIVPYCLILIEKKRKHNNESMCVTTRKSDKRPWSQLGVMNGVIPNSWIKNCISTENLMSYIIPTVIPCVMPIRDTDWDVDRSRNNFWKNASAKYAANCGSGRSTPKTLEKQLNYNNKLFKQFERHGEYVVYNTAGDNLYAARMSDIKHIVFAQLYSVECRSKNEALFLIALLNAESMLPAFKAARQSDRHFHTHLWYRVPLPRYDSTNSMHKKLAECGKLAEKKAMNVYDPDLTLGKNRLQIKKSLRDIGMSHKIDEICRELLPDHTRSS